MRPSFNVMNNFFFSLIKVNFCGIGDRQSAMLLFNSHGHTLKEVKSWFFPHIHVRHLIKFPKGYGIKFFLKKEQHIRNYFSSHKFLFFLTIHSIVVIILCSCNLNSKSSSSVAIAVE